MKSDTALDEMLARYRLWAILTICAFVLFAFLVTIGIWIKSTHTLIPFAILLSALFWLGMTALCRHSHVILETAMGKRIGTLEFLSTNRAVFLFPSLLLFFCLAKTEIRT